MSYKSLRKIYYTDAQNFESEYQRRFNSPSTRHFEIDIKEYNRSKAFPSFICYTEEMALLTEKIYKRFSSFRQIKDSVPELLLRQFVLSSLVDEIQSSNDIEGVYSTKKQIRSVLENNIDDKKALHLRSLVDKYERIISHKTIPFESCQDIRNFYDTFVLDEVLSEHPDNKPDGKIFRKDQVSVESQTGKIFHQGVYPEDILIETMAKALAILHSESIPAFVKIGVFHYLFGYMHPFYDGNGRTSRFITSYYLAEELDEIIALRLSVIIKKHKNNYYKLFQEANSEFNRGDLTPFITAFFNLLLSSLDDTIQVLSRKKAQLVSYYEKLKAKVQCDKVTLDIYYILLQAGFFYGEGVTIKQIKEQLQKSRVTIQNRINALPESHININKNTKPYRYKLNMAIFKNK